MMLLEPGPYPGENHPRNLECWISPFDISAWLVSFYVTMLNRFDVDEREY